MSLGTELPDSDSGHQVTALCSLKPPLCIASRLLAHLLDLGSQHPHVQYQGRWAKPGQRKSFKDNYFALFSGAHA